LNKRVIDLIGQAQFDTETFIELVERIGASLPEIGPRRLADEIKFLIHPEPGSDRRPPIVDRWEAMPATTRVKTERLLQTNPSRSPQRWFNDAADLLERGRPIRKRGAPRSITQLFVSRIAKFGELWD
jgi:hypothetical protein